MSSSRSTLHIKLSTIGNNYTSLRKLCPEAEVGAVVKANCYGLGADKITPVLQKSGCKSFFVANCEEGVNLRKILAPNADIYLLHGVFESELDVLEEYNLIPVLNHAGQVEIWKNFARKLGRKLPCFLHIDTGMHRLGMSIKEFNELINDRDINAIDILYVMSHLTSAESEENVYNKRQIEAFTSIADKLKDSKRSLVSSSGVFLGAKYHFDLVRPGAALYGINSTLRTNEPIISNPLRLFSPIIQIHEILPGESVGYDSTYTNNTNKTCRIATIPIGYADGFIRHLSNRGLTYINGVVAPVIGVISMDLTVIDVSLVPDDDLFLGQQVEIIGDNNKTDDMAKAAGTNSYEILTKLGYRFDKIYN
jgi:alanine racemase